jgi:hypothetical protein
MIQKPTPQGLIMYSTLKLAKNLDRTEILSCYLNMNFIAIKFQPL